jgi:hypothetical protein
MAPDLATSNAPKNLKDLEGLLTNDIKVKVAGIVASVFFSHVALLTLAQA